MQISPYFHNLRSAYAAELDDMTFDSEGKHILQQRLSQRRKEIDFLLNMMELSPEMVAVIFHKAFRFNSPKAMVHVLSHESEDLPEWDSLTGSVSVEPWAMPLVDLIRQQPQGDWFMTVAAALEYMFTQNDQAHGHDPRDADGDDEEDGEGALSAEDAEEEAEARAREEAGADWMAEQGFDRKE